MDNVRKLTNKDSNRTSVNSVRIVRLLNILFLFFYLFEPNISSVPTIFMLDFILITINIIRLVEKNGRVKLTKNTKKIAIPFVFFLSYYLVMMMIRFVSDNTSLSWTYLNNIRVYIVVIFRVMLVCGYLHFLVLHYNYTLNRIVNDIILAGCIEFILVLAAFLYPNIRSNFIAIMYRYGSYYIQQALKRDTWRSYGFAGNIFDAFGYTTSLIITLLFEKGIRHNNLRYIVASFFLMLMPLLNARTGIYLSLMGIIIVLFIHRRESIKGILKFFLISIVFILVGLNILSALPTATFSWIKRGFDDTLSFVLYGRASGIYESMFVDNIILPNDIMFGGGGDPIDIAGIGIESGYIQCIWRYGMIGTLLLLFAHAYLYVKLFVLTKNVTIRCYALVFGAIFFIYLFKLFSIYNYCTNIIVVGIPLFIICQFDNKNFSSLNIKG